MSATVGRGSLPNADDFGNFTATQPQDILTDRRSGTDRSAVKKLWSSPAEACLDPIHDYEQGADSLHISHVLHVPIAGPCSSHSVQLGSCSILCNADSPTPFQTWSLVSQILEERPPQSLARYIVAFVSHTLRVNYNVQL